MEHLRPASTLERLVATEWEEMISEIINSTNETPSDSKDPGVPHKFPPGADGLELAVPEAAAAPQNDFHSSSSAARGIQYPYPFHRKSFIHSFKFLPDFLQVVHQLYHLLCQHRQEHHQG